MMLPRMMRPVLFTATACLSLGSCCEPGLRSVEVYLSPDAGVLTAYVWRGDTLALAATAGTDAREFCYHPLFTSLTDPGRFTYQSSNPIVASVSVVGELVARADGATTITAMSSGVTSQPLAVIVSPPVASIRFTVGPATVEIGDTANVRIDALDSAGQIVVGAQVSYALLHPRDSVAITVLPPRPVPPSFDLATPVNLRILGLRAGVATLQVGVPRYSVRLTPVITAAVDIPVTAASKPLSPPDGDH